ncbi:MAG TPA: MgtC/SapB family protein [Gemmatimonadales bacterium]|nr:MgtC/SapB family protein [Gemmatimonadales bacterium]
MDVGEIALRLGAAVVVGSAIGLNRDLREKPAGLRTHALVTMGAALVTLTAYGLAEASGRSDPEPASRAMQGVITGIGFLGAGVILRPEGGRTVRGLTTAASIWLAAALGIACGAGLWPAVLIATALMLLVLIGGRPVERFLHRALGRDKSGREDRSG